MTFGVEFCTGLKLWKSLSTIFFPSQNILTASTTPLSLFFSHPRLGDTVLPCPLCLATKCGISHERWRDVSMHPIDLTRMQPRLRQHMIRTHKLTMRSPEVLSMRNFAKRMLCENLHTASPEFKPGLLLLQ